MIFFDQIGCEISLQTTPKKIVCLVPSITELLFDLGLENYIIGVTKFCVHPTKAKITKTIVGGTKNIKIDIIKQLNPDIILCNKEENTVEIVEKCSKITTTHVSDISSIEDVYELISMYGDIFCCNRKAQEIILSIKDKVVKFNRFIVDKKTVKTAYFIWKNPWMVASNNTFINSILELNKFENIFKSLNRYPKIELEELNKDVELILLSSEPYPFKEKHILEIKKTISNAKVVLVDGEMFSWYGSRLLKVFDYFIALQLRIREVSV